MAFFNFISPLNFSLSKTFSVLAVLTALQISCVAQDSIYHPFLEGEKEWVITGEPWKGSGKVTDLGDTVIGTEVYKRFRTYTPVNAFVREDTALKKVFIRTDYDTTEKILYDFSLLEGDSVFLTFKTSLNSGWYIVDSVRTVSILKGDRKVFYLFNAQNQVQCINKPPVLIWIEGIGSLIAPIYLEESFYSTQTGARDCFSKNIICSYKDGIQEYEDEAWKAVWQWEDCKTVNVPENLMDAKINIGPNPNRGKVTITTEDIPGPVNFYLYNYTGKLLSEFELSGNTDYSLDLTTNAPGIYFLKAVRKDGRGIKTFKVVKQ